METKFRKKPIYKLKGKNKDDDGKQGDGVPITIGEMICFLVISGFELEKIMKMGQAEFLWFFLNTFSVFTRGRQMNSSLMMSTIGSFLVKENERTIVEVLNDQIFTIKESLGEIESGSHPAVPKDIIDFKDLFED